MEYNLSSKTEKNKSKGLLNIIGNVFLIVTIFIVLFLGASMILPKFSYNLVTIKTASMEPTIKTGSVVITKKMSRYEEKDVITFLRFGKGLITHRIVKNVEQDGENKFKTKGDNNKDPDMILVEQEQVLGKVIISMPFFGYPIMWAKTTLGMLITGITLVGLVGYFIFGELSKIKKELNLRKNKL